MKLQLIKRAPVKQFAMHISETARAGKFTRVSASFHLRAEAALKAWIADAIHRHPSVGKTLK
jgi:hypothetical protein